MRWLLPPLLHPLRRRAQIQELMLVACSVSETKKTPKSNFLGQFCRQILRKVWGNFGNGGSKKVWVFSVCSLIFCIMGGLQTLNTRTFFSPSIAKISQNLSVYKISPKSLVWLFFLFLEARSGIRRPEDFEPDDPNMLTNYLLSLCLLIGQLRIK